jgi:hypothetical protein
VRATLPGWLTRVLAGVVLTQAALFLARPVTSYRALALGAVACALLGLALAAIALGGAGRPREREGRPPRVWELIGPEGCRPGCSPAWPSCSAWPRWR